MQLLSRRITAFARSLQPVEQLEAESGAEITVHAIAHAAMIILHRARLSTASVDLTVINAALMHATEILKLLEKISNANATQTGSSLVDPILSVSKMTSGTISEH